MLLTRRAETIEISSLVAYECSHTYIYRAYVATKPIMASWVYYLYKLSSGDNNPLVMPSLYGSSDNHTLEYKADMAVV